MSKKTQGTGSPKGTKPDPIKAGNTGYRKRCSPKEIHFAKLIADTGMGGVEASRIALGWASEPGSKENDNARNLARAPRIKAEIQKHTDRALAEEKAKESMRVDFGEMHKGDLREYAFKVLEKLRDNPKAKAADRFNAIKMLKKLHDPGKDVNLIYKWIDLAWRYQTAHCPACHSSFALADIRNSRLADWRDKTGATKGTTKIPRRFDRQMEIIKRCDPRRTPHAGQVRILCAPERHVVGEGAARAGKSYLLGLIATMAICLPGVEIWILAETYDRASKEVEYIKNFLNALFFPYYKQMVNVVHDKKTGEMIMTTKWGSEIRVKSAKSKGSITGHALEFALCAEPGWLPADIYEELRARMSERLGRIVALGTPKGVAGFIGRLTNMHGRDPKTGRMIRWKRDQRLIANGCPWNVSMLVTRLDPQDNPEFVKSELDAARMELTDEEYASEFEGIGVSAEGAKFGLVRDDHLRMIEDDFFDRAVFILGIDQGPRNFGGCLIAYDGNDIVTVWEYFNSDERTTMKKNLVILRSRVPRWIEALGGDPDRWLYTITDEAPMLNQIFTELADEGQPWPMDVQLRHKNMAKLGENWRRENQEFINNMARYNHLFFHLLDFPFTAEDESPGSYLIHDQVRQCLDVAENRERESKSGDKKGWLVSDPFRGDHVLDAWYLAIWMICSQQVNLPKSSASRSAADPWALEKEQFEAALRDRERKELGLSRREPGSAREAWQQVLRGKNSQGVPGSGWRGHYGNEA
jgi:hypothetical protein